MKIIELSPGSVQHTLKNLYHSFQLNGGRATLEGAGDEIQICQETEADHATRQTRTTLKIGSGGITLELSGPAMETGDNPIRPVPHWFYPDMMEDIAKVLSVFGTEIEVDRHTPFFGKVVRRKADVEKTPVDMYCHIVVGMEPGTGDLITYRAESEDRKFRINSIPKSDIDGLAAVPTDQEAAVRFSYLVQKMGSRALAAMLDTDQLTRLWDSNYRYQP